MSTIKSVEDGKITVTHAADEKGSTETTFEISKEREEKIVNALFNALIKSQAKRYEAMYVLRRMASNEWSILMGVWRT